VLDAPEIRQREGRLPENTPAFGGESLESRLRSGAVGGSAMHQQTTDSQLMKYAEEGRLTKHALATMLTPESRRKFLEACAAIERKYTIDCGTQDTCLEAGCSAEGEICLQPLLRAGSEYHKACAAEWAKLFARHENRLR
jgi:hypothetical protein